MQIGLHTTAKSNELQSTWFYCNILFLFMAHLFGWSRPRAFHDFERLYNSISFKYIQFYICQHGHANAAKRTGVEHWKVKVIVLYDRYSDTIIIKLCSSNPSPMFTTKIHFESQIVHDVRRWVWAFEPSQSILSLSIATRRLRPISMDEKRTYPIFLYARRQICLIHALILFRMPCRYSLCAICLPKTEKKIGMRHWAVSIRFFHMNSTVRACFRLTSGPKADEQLHYIENISCTWYYCANRTTARKRFFMFVWYLNWSTSTTNANYTNAWYVFWFRADEFHYNSKSIQKTEAYLRDWHKREGRRLIECCFEPQTNSENDGIPFILHSTNEFQTNVLVIVVMRCVSVQLLKYITWPLAHSNYTHIHLEIGPIF